jgi:hypothetical protein
MKEFIIGTSTLGKLIVEIIEHTSEFEVGGTSNQVCNIILESLIVKN